MHPPCTHRLRFRLSHWRQQDCFKRDPVCPHRKPCRPLLSGPRSLAFLVTREIGNEGEQARAGSEAPTLLKSQLQICAIGAGGEQTSKQADPLQVRGAGRVGIVEGLFVALSLGSPEGRAAPFGWLFAAAAQDRARQAQGGRIWGARAVRCCKSIAVRSFCAAARTAIDQQHAYGN